MRNAWLILILAAQPLSAGNNSITNARFAFSFSKFHHWDYLSTTRRDDRLFDLVRLYPGSGKPAASPARTRIAARIYLRILATKGKRLVDHSRSLAASIRNQGFSVMERKRKMVNRIPLLYLRFVHSIPYDPNQRNLWISIRLFTRNNRFFHFYTAAYSREELRQAEAMFRNLRFHD